MYSHHVLTNGNGFKCEILLKKLILIASVNKLVQDIDISENLTIVKASINAWYELFNSEGEKYSITVFPRTIPALS